MCRSYADPNGYYRCVPGLAFLSLTSSPDIAEPTSDNYIRGVFWHDDKVVPTIDEILYVKSGMEQRIAGFPKSDDKSLELYEYEHLGNMVGLLIDSNVPHFDRRLVEIQELVVEYHRLNASGSTNDALRYTIEKKITDSTLSLGYDIRKSTESVLHQLGITGGDPIPNNKFLGNKKLKPLFVEISKHFPSTWNSKVIARKLLKLNKKMSSFTPNDTGLLGKPHIGPVRFGLYRGKFKIHEGQDGVFYYRSLEEAEAAKEMDSLTYHTRHEIAHEMTHMFEKNSYDIKEITAYFVKQRVSPKNGKPVLDENYSNPTDGSEPETIYKNGNFAHPFTGQVYNTSSTENEILARGVESVLFSANGSLVGLPTTGMLRGKNKPSSVTSIVPDIEHRNLTLGILVGYKLDSKI